MKEYKELLYKQFAQVGKAVSNGTRLELLDLLCQGERTVEELARETESSISSISQHLQILKTARLLASRKEGLHVYYFLADDSVAEFWRAMRVLAVSRSAELREAIHTFMGARDELEQVSHNDLLQRAARGDVVVLDVRPKAEFHAGHIPEAMSMPVEELEKHLTDLPRDREIVAYCRGPYCLMSVEAVNLLRRHGFKARRLEDGFPEWRAGGYPVDTASGDTPGTRDADRPADRS